MLDLSIIIVTWNVRDYLLRCLRSLEEGIGSLKTEVFVVDNGSTDGTASAIRNFEFRISNFEFISNKKNLGFAKANNQAIEKATGRYILLLNPDTECPPKSLEKMVRWMDEHPRCGILGPKLLNTNGSFQKSVRRFPNAVSQILLSLGLRWKSVTRYLAEDFDYTKDGEVDQVMGACFCIRRTMLEAIGVLDPRFFIWFEEVDYCRRAKAAGWEIWYTPTISIIHYGGESFSQIRTVRKQWIYSRSLLAYFAKYHEWRSYVLTLCTFPFRIFFSLFFS